MRLFWMCWEVMRRRDLTCKQNNHNPTVVASLGAPWVGHNRDQAPAILEWKLAKTTITHNKNVTNRVKVRCRICKNVTQHVVLADTVINGKEHWGGDEWFDWTDEFQIVQCLGCENTAFRMSHTDSEHDFVDVYGQDVQGVEVNVYPNPYDGRTAITDIQFLPVQLRNIYEETIKSLNNQQVILAGMGIRAIVETVCKDKNASGKDLYDKIRDLVGQSVLSSDGAETLQRLRSLGNAAAHEVKHHSQDQLCLALDVVDNLLLSVYVLPKRAEIGLPKKRE